MKVSRTTKASTETPGALRIQTAPAETCWEVTETPAFTVGIPRELGRPPRHRGHIEGGNETFQVSKETQGNYGNIQGLGKIQVRAGTPGEIGHRLVSVETPGALERCNQGRHTQGIQEPPLGCRRYTGTLGDPWLFRTHPEYLRGTRGHKSSTRCIRPTGSMEPPGEPGSHPRSGRTQMANWENTLGISRPSTGIRETAQDETGKPGKGTDAPRRSSHNCCSERGDARGECVQVLI